MRRLGLWGHFVNDTDETRNTRLGLCLIYASCDPFELISPSLDADGGLLLWLSAPPHAFSSPQAEPHEDDPLFCIP